MNRLELIMTGVWWTVIGIAWMIIAPVVFDGSIVINVLIGLNGILCGWLCHSNLSVLAGLSIVFMTLFTIGFGFLVFIIVALAYPPKWLAIALIFFALITIVLCVRNIYNQIKKLWQEV